MKNYKKIIIWALVIIIAILLIVKITFVKEVLFVIFLSLIIAYSLKPIQQILISKGLNVRFSAFILVFFSLGVFVLIFSTLIPTIIKESTNISKAFEDIEVFVYKIYEKINVNNNRLLLLFYESANEKLNRMAGEISINFFDTILSLGENLFSFAVIPVITYYFLSDSSYICSKMIMLLPVQRRTILRNIGKNINRVLGRYILSQFFLCLLIGLLTYGILSALKINFPILLSLINAAFNIIPYFGPLFGAVPAIILSLTISYEKAIWVTLCLYFIQQIEGDIISPKIIGQSISMHPLAIIILLLIGGKIGGFLGMVLAIPAGVIIKIIYEDINYYIF